MEHSAADTFKMEHWNAETYTMQSLAAGTWKMQVRRRSKTEPSAAKQLILDHLAAATW